MSEWKTVKLGNVTEIISGYAFKSEDFQAKGIPVIKIANIKNGHVSIEEGNTEYLDPYFIKKINKKFIVEKGDVLISLTGSHLTQPNSVVGRVAQYRYNSVSFLNQRAGKLKIIDSENCINSYLYYFLVTHSMRQEIALLAHGAANQANVSPKDIEKLKVRIPSLNVQKKIAAVLSAYDDLIENNDRRITLLEKMAEEIYREWFVRLRFPGFDRATFHKGIPEGWEMVQLGDIVKDIIDYRGITPGKLNSDWQNEGIAALSALNVKKGKLIRIEDSKCVSDELFEKWMRKKLDRLDILLTSEAPLGEVYILMKKEKYVLSQRLFAIRANPKKIQPIYLYYYLLCEVGQYELTSKATGSTVGGIRQALLRKVEILKPTNLFQEKFASIAEPILEDIYKLWNKNNLLKQTRDRLLTRLISGKLSVEDLDIQFPPSMTTDP
jgi:type I restriction enzyme, S subunit